MMKAMEVFTDETSLAKLVEVPKPEPRAGEVRVRVVCAAIDRGSDAVLRNENIRTVDVVGSDVTDLVEGDAVFGFLDYDPDQIQGSFSEYVVVATEKTAIKPKDIPFDIAAASSCESLTALQALRDEGGLTEGQKILIIGAGGGVGSAAVMIAKNLKAHVTAVCSTKDAERIKHMGADIVIDRTTDPEGVQNSPREAYNVVFDVPNTTSWWGVKHMLVTGGAYVQTRPSFGFFRDKPIAFLTLSKNCFVACKPRRADFELVAEWLSKKTLDVNIDSHFKISELNDAFKRQREPDKLGRVVIDVENAW